MRDVSIIGIGQTKVKEHWDKSLRDLAVESVLAAMEDAGVEEADALFVGNMLSGEMASQEHLAALIADFAGLRGVEAVKVEAAGAAGAAALRMGYLSVASGLYDLVIVNGVEKMTERPSNSTAAFLALAADGDYEAIHGLSLVGLNALLMRRYMHEYGVKHEDFAFFSVNAHRNALSNEYAMFRKAISVEDVRRARVIADPINLLDSAPIGDGSASVLLCPTETAKGLTKPSVRILASAVATDAVALHDRRDPLFLQAAHDSAYKAYRQAGLKPEDIDIFELHDAFTIMAALSLEACGFAPRGEGVRLAKEGQIALEGRIPISTMGGLKARGDPVGATGIYQVVELVRQLRGEAGKNQVDCQVGMAQSIGGTGATAITHILAALM